MAEEKKLYLFDAFALIFRAYYALAKNPLVNSKGMNTGTISGFTSTVHEIIKKYEPTHCAIVFDAPAATDRQKEHAFYKANRQETPEDIAVAIPYIKKIVDALNIPRLELEGYEADDLIGTMAKTAVKKGFEVYMVSPDKDFGQLVEERIFIHKPPFMKKGHQILGLKEIKEKWEVEDPLQVIDILGMWGDSVDNIPGIPGVGEKTAKKFIKAYGSIEGLYEHTDELKGKMKEKVEANYEQAMISKKLATIILDAPIEFDEEDLLVSPINKEALSEIFAELEFRTLGHRIIGKEYDPNMALSSGGQMGLFGNDASNGDYIEKGKDATNVDHNYKLVNSKAAQTKLVQSLLKQKVVAFDTETTGLDANACELVGMSFSYKKNSGYYIPFPENKKACEATLEIFKPFFESDKIVKVGQNAKYDMLVLKRYGIEVASPIYDTMLAHYLIEPDGRHNMNILSENFLGYAPISIEQLIGPKGKNQLTMRDVDMEALTEYASEDADITFQLFEILDKKVKETNVEDVLNKIELPLLHVLTEMEHEGVTVDKKFLDEYSVELGNEIKTTSEKIFEYSKSDFNIDSPKQLGEVLFGKMKLPYSGKKTKTGQFSTNEEVLSKLKGEHEIIEEVLNYRQLTKLKSTYVDALPNMINAETGKVHTTFNQTIAATGRLSSVNPNLQNIPIRTERGREIRKAFIPGKGNIILSADYSQIELRIMASMSEDKNMIEAFNNNLDIHSATAARVFNIDLDQVDADVRRKAKVVNFGIIYGISAFGLSQRLGIPRKEAADLISAYFKQYPGIKKYMDQSIQFARDNGYVKTLTGRIRKLRDINSKNFNVRGFAERNAINSPIQGSAADMIKIAMINVQNRLQHEKLKTKMILQVHDELLFDTPPGELPTVEKLVDREMQNALPLNVPIEVGMGSGNNWLEAH